MFFRLAASLVTSAVIFTSLSGCATGMYPVSTGSHGKLTKVDLNKPPRVVVWGNHPSVTNAVTQRMQELNLQVLERARLKEVLNEQKIRLTNTPDDEADLLRVGRLLGADWIIFAEATITAAQEHVTAVDESHAFSRAHTVYHLSVSVRNVMIETSEVRWSGTSTYPGPITNLDQGLVTLTRYAIARAVCPLENGYTWDEGEGCKKPQ